MNERLHQKVNGGPDIVTVRFPAQLVVGINLTATVVATIAVPNPDMRADYSRTCRSRFYAHTFRWGQYAGRDERS